MQALSCGMWTLSCGILVGSSSPARDQTLAPCIGSAESYPLDHLGSSQSAFLTSSQVVLRLLVRGPHCEWQRLSHLAKSQRPAQAPLAEHDRSELPECFFEIHI